MKVAGHEFANGLCSCGIRWMDIRGADDSCADDSCVGKLGWAHSGNLTTDEWQQIVKHREAEEERIATATADVAAVGSAR